MILAQLSAKACHIRLLGLLTFDPSDWRSHPPPSGDLLGYLSIGLSVACLGC